MGNGYCRFCGIGECFRHNRLITINQPCPECEGERIAKELIKDFKENLEKALQQPAEVRE